MKRIVWLLLYTAVVFGIVGCGGGGSTFSSKSFPGVSDYRVTDESLAADEKASLHIEAISEDENGNKITVGALSDVVATRDRQYTDYTGNTLSRKQVVFRSFNFDKWKGKLNAETTLLSRLFMGTDFFKLAPDKKREIVSKVIHSKYYNNALLSQLLYIENSILYEGQYRSAISVLSKIIDDNMQIPQHSVRSSNKQLRYKQLRYKSEINNIGGGLKLIYDSDTNVFNFHNYFSLYYGLRTYDKNNATYNIKNTIFDNLIEPVSGGLLGGGIAKLSDMFNLPSYIGTPADDKKFGRDFDNELYLSEKVLRPNIHKTYEIYKYQGFELCTIYNVAHATEIVLNGVLKKDWRTKLDKSRKKLQNLKENILQPLDDILASLEVLVVLKGYMNTALAEMEDNTLSYKIEDGFNKIRTILDQISSIIPSVKNRYETYYEDNIQNRPHYIDLNKALGVLNINEPLIKNSTLKKALRSEKKFSKKQKYQIMAIGYYFSQYIEYTPKIYPDVKNNDFFQKYNYISPNDYAYIAVMGTFMKKEDFRQLMKTSYRRDIDFVTYEKDYMKFLALLNKKYSMLSWGEQLIKDSLTKIKELEEIAKVADLFRNSMRHIVNADLLSRGSLKFLLSSLKDILFDGFDTNHLAALIANFVTKVTGMHANVAMVFNEGASFAWGSIALPNKMYFDVATDEHGKLSVKFPDYAPLGVLSDNINEVNNWYGLKGDHIFQGKNGTLAIQGSYHIPVYKFYFMSGNPDEIFNKSFPNNTFMHIAYKIRRSLNDTKGFFEDDLENSNNTFVSNISPATITAFPSLWHSGDYGYYFDIWEAYQRQEDLSIGNVTIYNKTRGIYKEWMEINSYYPLSTEDKKSPITSNIRYVYKVANTDTLGKNVYIERVSNSVRVQNEGDFTICYARSNNQQDVCIAPGTGLMLENIDFNQNITFFDGILERFIDDESYVDFNSFLQQHKYDIDMDNMSYTVGLQNLTKKQDSDNDGLSDEYERSHGYRTDLKDSDGDHIDDLWEIQHGLDPSNGSDAQFRTLGGYTNLEYYILVTNGMYIQPVQKNSIFGIVTTPDGTPLANVTVKFEYIKNDQSTSVQDVTGVDGTYRMEFSKKDFDNIRDNAKLIVYAYADGYVPKTREITKTEQENFHEDFVLEPIKPNEIVLEIEPHLHHLGDGKYSGSVNSEFQRAGAEGTEFSKTFFIDDFQYNNFKRAKVTFEAKGVQNYNDRLIINDYSTSLQSSPDDGSYGTQSFTIDKSEYHPGENEIKITSGYTTDFDDFEFINVKITFIEPDDTPYTSIETNATSLEYKTLIQDDGLEAKIAVDTLRIYEKSATIDYKAENCGGELIYFLNDDDGFVFSEHITYGNCGIDNCQLWIKNDGTQYKLYCDDATYDGNLRVLQ